MYIPSWEFGLLLLKQGLSVSQLLSSARRFNWGLMFERFLKGLLLCTFEMYSLSLASFDVMFPPSYLKGFVIDEFSKRSFSYFTPWFCWCFSPFNLELKHLVSLTSFSMIASLVNFKALSHFKSLSSMRYLWIVILLLLSINYQLHSNIPKNHNELE